MDAGAGDTTLEIEQSLVKQMIDGTPRLPWRSRTSVIISMAFILSCWADVSALLRQTAIDWRLLTAPKRVEAADLGVIIPRKGVLELSRLLEGAASISLAIGTNHIRATTTSIYLHF